MPPRNSWMRGFSVFLVSMGTRSGGLGRRGEQARRAALLLANVLFCLLYRPRSRRALGRDVTKTGCSERGKTGPHAVRTVFLPTSPSQTVSRKQQVLDKCSGKRKQLFSERLFSERLRSSERAGFRTSLARWSRASSQFPLAMQTSPRFRCSKDWVA